MDQYKWSDRFYQAAQSIAVAEKTGANIFNILQELWPAGLRGNLVHYNGRPFDAVHLVSEEGLSDCVIAPALRNFRFDMEKIWPEENTNGSNEQSDSPKRNKKRYQQSDNDFDQEESESDDELPKARLMILFKIV